MESDIINKVSPMEADAEGQSNLKRMLCEIGIQVTTVIKEILQAGLDIETNVRREVVLQTEAKGRGPLYGNTER